MAGFHLLFNSDRKESISSLYGTKSKRVMIDYDYSKMPSMAWVKNNIVLLGSALALFGLFIFLFIRAFKRPQSAIAENEEATQTSAN